MVSLTGQLIEIRGSDGCVSTSQSMASPFWVIKSDNSCCWDLPVRVSIERNSDWSECHTQKRNLEGMTPGLLERMNSWGSDWHQVQHLGHLGSWKQQYLLQATLAPSFEQFYMVSVHLAMVFNIWRYEDWGIKVKNPKYHGKKRENTVHLPSQ